MTGPAPARGRPASLDPDDPHRLSLEEPVSDRLLRLALRAQTRVEGADAERGDVPGWVMITIMTAGIVTFIWGFADDALKNLFEGAINGVKKPA